MLQALRRNKIFKENDFADQVISGYQRSYASSFDPAIAHEKYILDKYYDRLDKKPAGTFSDTAYAIYAWPAETWEAYISGFAPAVSHFLKALNINEIYLLDFLCTDMLEFPFETYSKKNAFKRRGGKKGKQYGYKLAADAVTEILPLFYFARKWDIPLIFFISADKEVPLAIHLCDDGNLHLDYTPSLTAVIEAAAIRAGLVTEGDLTCDVHSLTILKNRAARDGWNA